MKCVSPYVTGWGSDYVAFPCGHCAVCRQKKASEWALRLMFESRLYSLDNIAFVTLTYSPEHLPENYSLVPSDLSSFVKRLRKHLSVRNAPKIRFFGCGEYGDKRSRPHYHLLIFGLNKKDWDCIKKSWHYGLIDIQQPYSTGSVESYVAGYVSKKQPKIHYGKYRIPPFHRQSKGIGWNFVDRTFPHFSPICIIKNKTRYIGRYLRNKLAEKFNCLEETKKEGISKMIENFKQDLRNFMIEFDWFESAFYFSPIKACKKAYPLYYQGDLELLLSRQKIFTRRDL